MRIFSLLLLMVIICGSCEEEIQPTDFTVPCIQEKIEEYLAAGIFCDDGRVVEYWFQEDYVYVFERGTCIADGDADVFSLRCSRICTLGGITGSIVCNGDDFNNEAKELQIIFP